MLDVHLVFYLDALKYDRTAQRKRIVQHACEFV